MKEKAFIRVNKHGEHVVKYDTVKVERTGDLLRFVLVSDNNDLYFSNWQDIPDDGEALVLAGLTAKLKIKLSTLDK